MHRRRYNVVGDLMRPSEMAASSSVDGHIVSHAVNMAINSFNPPWPSDEIVEKRGGFGPLDLHSLFAWCNPVSSRYFPPPEPAPAQCGRARRTRVQGTRPLAKAPALAPERGLQYSICLTFLPLWWG
eukprot:scaffold19020_cov50-Skeletonema_dohrnii-CCMP3373.AAC.1